MTPPTFRSLLVVLGTSSMSRTSAQGRLETWSRRSSCCAETTERGWALDRPDRQADRHDLISLEHLFFFPCLNR
jgi:hypothetical protein